MTKDTTFLTLATATKLPRPKCLKSNTLAELIKELKDKGFRISELSHDSNTHVKMWRAVVLSNRPMQLGADDSVTRYGKSWQRTAVDAVKSAYYEAHPQFKEKGVVVDFDECADSALDCECVG